MMLICINSHFRQCSESKQVLQRNSGHALPADGSVSPAVPSHASGCRGLHGRHAGSFPGGQHPQCHRVCLLFHSATPKQHAGGSRRSSVIGQLPAANRKSVQEVFEK